MRILLNNREEEIIDKQQITVEELLEYKKFSFKFLVVKINGELVKKDHYGSTQISDGDQVMVLHLISGG
jgi:thiamine biosynthesis protein ThiS